MPQCVADDIAVAEDSLDDRCECPDVEDFLVVKFDLIPRSVLVPTTYPPHEEHTIVLFMLD